METIYDKDLVELSEPTQTFLDETQMRDMRRLQVVPRWCVVPTRGQSVAEHTFHTMWIYLWIMEKTGKSPTIGQIVDVMSHDADEARTGDIPSTAKKRKTNPLIGMNHHDMALKLADGLEAWLFIREEIEFGASHLDAIARDVADKTEPFAAGLGLIFGLVASDLWEICDPCKHPSLE